MLKKVSRATSPGSDLLLIRRWELASFRQGEGEGGRRNIMVKT
jgi:hypothetical protein